VVSKSCIAPLSATNKARALHIKLARLAKAPKKWHKEKVVANRRGSEQAQQLVLQMDQIQDERQLTESEFQHRKEAKNRILALAVVKKDQTPSTLTSHVDSSR
jgi:hypothetical protein